MTVYKGRTTGGECVVRVQRNISNEDLIITCPLRVSMMKISTALLDTHNSQNLSHYNFLKIKFLLKSHIYVREILYTKHAYLHLYKMQTRINLDI